MLALYSVEEGGEALAERRLCSMLRNKSIVKTKYVVKACVYVSSSVRYGICVLTLSSGRRDPAALWMSQGLLSYAKPCAAGCG